MGLFRFFPLTLTNREHRKNPDLFAREVFLGFVSFRPIKLLVKERMGPNNGGNDEPPEPVADLDVARVSTVVCARARAKLRAGNRVIHRKRLMQMRTIMMAIVTNACNSWHAARRPTSGRGTTRCRPRTPRPSPDCTRQGISPSSRPSRRCTSAKWRRRMITSRRL